MGATKLQILGVTKEFTDPALGTRFEVLQEVNLDIQAGEFLTIVGPSGCGKTTLLRILDGLVRPSRGRILLDGHEVTEPGFDRAFVFQRGGLFPWRTVLGNVAFGLETRGEPAAGRVRRAQELLRLVGLEGFAHYYPHQISGGMQQRVNLARALAVNPEVLLMDEPFAALDAQTREIMQRELLRIWRAERKTVVFVTHQIDEAIYLSDRVVVMSARPGRIKMLASVDLPRPRDIDLKRTSEFLKYAKEIWEVIKEEVEKTLSLEFGKEPGRGA
ncbi:MAG: ABC transporter ATP-binding protein [Deltaproteobacteria bacterium]|nr:ABC transporter ATP-binding protein [Deltaproteobacteria bacterium]